MRAVGAPPLPRLLDHLHHRCALGRLHRTVELHQQLPLVLSEEKVFVLLEQGLRVSVGAPPLRPEGMRGGPLPKAPWITCGAWIPKSSQSLLKPWMRRNQVGGKGSLWEAVQLPHLPQAPLSHQCQKSSAPPLPQFHRVRASVGVPPLRPRSQFHQVRASVGFRPCGPEASSITGSFHS